MKRIVSGINNSITEFNWIVSGRHFSYIDMALTMNILFYFDSNPFVISEKVIEFSVAVYNFQNTLLTVKCIIPSFYD